MRLALLVFASVPLWGQSLQVTPSIATHGEAGSFLIKIMSPKGKELVALQWEISAPGQVALDPRNIVAGSAAEAAQKSITCAPREQNPGRTLACILAGGKKIIPDGPLATVRYNIRKEAGSGTVAVRIEKVLGVRGDLTNVALGNAEGTLTIR